MALSSAQRQTLQKAFAARKSTPGSKAQRAIIAKKVGRDNSGGEAYRQWQDDPGANWIPQSHDGSTPSSTRNRPLPKYNKKNGIYSTGPIPNSSPLRNGMGQRGRKRYA